MESWEQVYLMQEEGEMEICEHLSYAKYWATSIMNIQFSLD
jgi:hypothetical protein